MPLLARVCKGDAEVLVTAVQPATAQERHGHRLALVLSRSGKRGRASGAGTAARCRGAHCRCWLNGRRWRWLRWLGRRGRFDLLLDYVDAALKIRAIFDHDA